MAPAYGTLDVVTLAELFRVLLAKKKQKKKQQQQQNKNKRGNSTSTVSTRHFYPVDSRTGRLHGNYVMTIPRSDRVSTEKGWKSVLLENVKPLSVETVDPNRTRPKCPISQFFFPTMKNFVILFSKCKFSNS